MKVVTTKDGDGQRLPPAAARYRKQDIAFRSRNAAESSKRQRDRISMGSKPLRYSLFRASDLAFNLSARWRGNRSRRSAGRRRSRVGQVLGQSGRDVGPRRGCGARQRFSELLLRQLTEQSAPEPAVAVQVDVPAQPLPAAHIGVLLAGCDVELLALTGSRRNFTLRQAIRVVERIEVRHHAGAGAGRSRCCELTQNGGAVQAVHRRSAEAAGNSGRNSVLRQHIEPTRSERRADDRHVRSGRGRWTGIHGGRGGDRWQRLRNGGRREGDRRCECD